MVGFSEIINFNKPDFENQTRLCCIKKSENTYSSFITNTSF